MEITLQTFVHYFLHLVFPAIVAILAFKKEWKKAYLIFLATMLVDLDHFVATPIFLPNRCSIQFHFLHTYNAMIFYVALLLFPKPFRIIGIGCLMHMATDFIDCMVMFSTCNTCYADAPAYHFMKIINSLFLD